MMSRFAFYSPVFRPAYRVNGALGADPFFSLLRDVIEPTAAPAEVEYTARVKVSETETEFRLAAELPGVSKEDIDVSIDGAQVSISAKVKADTLAEGERVLRTERSEGRFTRTVTLGGEIDEAQANAKYENGVLVLVLPKKAQPAARKLAIH
jgi:HSP20 family protein